MVTNGHALTSAAPAAPVVNAAQQAEIDKLKKQIADLQRAARPAKGLTFKVAEKGGISVQGLQGFPVTLYANQWAKVLQAGDALKAFMLANFDALSFKSAEDAAAVDTWLGRTLDLTPKS